MIRYDLRGKAAIVTGGASGIGLATATVLAQAGARVAINFLPNDVRGREACARLNTAGCNVVEAPGDVAVPAEAEKMVVTAIDRLGRLDLLVNNAATPATRKVIAPADLHLVSEELWHSVLDSNLLSVFFCTRAAAPALKFNRGAVVNTASVAGLDAQGSSLAYAASKAGVINLTKSLARALAPEVRVNAVAPGSVDSPWMVEWTEDERRHSTERALLKARCKPQDIAEAIVFLGIAGSMITGQTLVIDGGRSL
jgi:3-oxoacyl-[acyl-carrier protein] reductase